MSNLNLITPCERCRRYQCSDRRACDDAYIKVLEERLRHWQLVARAFHERARLEDKGWQEPRRGGRGRLLPEEFDA